MTEDEILMNIDAAYIEGARQAMRMAEQSMDTARAWVLGGCGSRAADVLRVRREIRERNASFPT